MKPQNLLFIFSDEHTREITGCYGNDFIATPNIDALAARGTRFDSAYTNCPICVPARASLATGRYVHDNGCWDNAHGYHGAPRGWGHRLIDAGHEAVSIGKLHYRSSADPTGWSDEIDTLHIVDGVGDLYGCVRADMSERATVSRLAAEAGPGDSGYIRYDARIADQASEWLGERAGRDDERPWVLFVGFVLPHFPLIAPPELYDLYPPEKMPPPRLYAEHERPTHPVVRAVRRAMAYDDYFDERTMRIGRSAYFGMVSCLDRNIGQVLDALSASGLADDTRVLYTSDHGDNIGHRGMWGKSVMYEEAAAVPMIIAGADVPAGRVVTEPVSLVDCYQTIVEGAGLELDQGEQQDLPGHSLLGFANGDTPERVVLSEYHAAGSPTGFYMIRNGRWKYVHYVGAMPELFDLEADPHEERDLGTDPGYRAVVDECEAMLCSVVDPEEASARAFRDQAAMVESHGGVDAIRRRGEFAHTPAPGDAPDYGDG